ncbi:hypothetical protein OG806_49440 [Streptomyces sp. NBC_00882]|uniref:hypothetical protein n=1 Tax=Streptomyces TaxID=1883 RepID=UPI00386BBB60|nr:hypothetical protein OG806_00510 [Streptomyces sp. NBC_00882]WSZ36843.1 hypothetical protein OG806_49440 [Streptomyces sp. NBC_00882]WSZ55080.1 hypothetical protein OH824_00105 [Streptomyces canus]WSZ63830.1 hypothetical protein OH824_48715 [Streptomyces canus]
MDGNRDPLPDDSFYEEHLPPERTTWPAVGEPTHMDKTREKIALRLLWLVAILAVVPTLALIFSRWSSFTDDQFRELTLVFTPVVALGSAAFGFYFGSNKDDQP